MKPVVAVVGRPNVGKSTFFNRIVGKRIAIVEDEPGVTRDRIFAEAEWCGNKFDLVDTGGLDPHSEDIMKKHILTQANLAINMSDVIIFMVDGKDGLVAGDTEVADLLRKSRKPVLLVVNKLDNYEVEKSYDFYELGLGEPICISSTQAKGIGDLLDKVVTYFPKQEGNEQASDIVKIAIVGKTNVGKSSLANRLVGEERVIVSDIAGTTRDAIDIVFKYHKKEYLIIDTAGLRRKRSIEDETVERYSVFRTIDSIKRADIVLVVMDASEPLSEQDIRIAGLVHESDKPSVIVMNKWDKVEKDTNTMKEKERLLGIDLAFMSYYRSVYVSALEGNKIDNVMKTVQEVMENNSRRITTGTLNDVLQNAMATTPTPMKNGKQLKIYYGTQTGANPPNIVLFVNDKNIMTDSYKRFIENSLRKAIDFTGTPIHIVCKNRGEE